MPIHLQVVYIYMYTTAPNSCIKHLTQKRKTNIVYYTESRKNGTDEPICYLQGRNRDTDIEKGPVDTVWGGEGETK